MNIYTASNSRTSASGQYHDDLLLDYAALPPQLGMEARLSRLCAWVLAAEHANLPYGLRLEQL